MQYSQINGKFTEAKACECELPISSEKRQKVMTNGGEKVKKMLILSTINGMK